MAKVEVKQPIVDKIAEEIKDAQSVVLVDYRGLTVAQDTELRKQLREAGVIYKVYKNTMMKRAFEGTEFAALDDCLEGPSAIAISKDDATAPARILYKFAQDAPALELKGGVVEGTAYDVAGISELAKIPSRDELLSKLLGSLQPPITNFARVINQIAEQGGEAAPAEEAAAEEKKGNYVKEEPGKGFRRIVAAPKPLDIVEIDAINALAAAGQIVIACGGGGIPVLKQGSSLKGASAVIEKDLVSGLLADQTDADMLMILTNDEFVNIKYGTPEEVALKQITAEEARTHIANHEFGVNKMLPKIEASVNFVCRREERSAVITSIDKALDAYRGKTGTVITA